MSVRRAQAGLCTFAVALTAACGTSADSSQASAPAAMESPAAESPAAESPAETATPTPPATAPAATTAPAAPAETAAPPAQEEVVITIVDYTFNVPASVPPGAVVTVVNQDTVFHTVTADDGTTFDVASPKQESVTFTAPMEPGEYPFHCGPHPNMRATLVVG